MNFLYALKKMLDLLRGKSYTGDVVMRVHFFKGGPSHLFEWTEAKWNTEK